MKGIIQFCTFLLLAHTTPSTALSLAPEEIKASRQIACVLARQSLGQLSEAEYGEKSHTLLDSFDEIERDNILAQAVGYFGGIVFSTTEDGADKRTLRLQSFVSSSTCSTGPGKVTLNL